MINYKNKKIITIIAAFMIIGFSFLIYHPVKGEKKEGLTFPSFKLFANNIQITNAPNTKVANLIKDINSLRISNINDLLSALGKWNDKPVAKIPTEVLVSNHQMAAYTFFAPAKKSTPINVRTRYLGEYTPTLKIIPENQKDINDYVVLTHTEFKERNINQSDDRNNWTFNFTCPAIGVWYMEVIFKQGNKYSNADPVDYNDYYSRTYKINCANNIDTNPASLPDLIIERTTFIDKYPGILSDLQAPLGKFSCMDEYGNFYATQTDLKRVISLMMPPQDRKSCKNNPVLLDNWVYNYEVCIKNIGTFPAAKVNMSMSHSYSGFYWEFGLLAYNSSRPEECACETGAKIGECCGDAIPIEEGSFNEYATNLCNKSFCGAWSQLHARNNYCQAARYISFMKGAYDSTAQGLRSSSYYNSSFTSEIEQYLNEYKTKILNIYNLINNYKSGRFDIVGGSNVTEMQRYFSELSMLTTMYIPSGKTNYNPSIASIIGEGQDLKIFNGNFTAINNGDGTKQLGKTIFWEPVIEVIDSGATKCMNISLYQKPLITSRTDSTYTFDFGPTALNVDPFNLNKESNEVNNSDLTAKSSNCQGRNDNMKYCEFEYYKTPLIMGKQYHLSTTIGSAKTDFTDLNLNDACYESYKNANFKKVFCDAKMSIISGKWFLPNMSGYAPTLPNCPNGAKIDTICQQEVNSVIYSSDGTSKTIEEVISSYEQKDRSKNEPPKEDPINIPKSPEKEDRSGEASGKYKCLRGISCSACTNADTNCIYSSVEDCTQQCLNSGR